MRAIKLILTVVLMFYIDVTYAQTITIKGHISDIQGNNLFAVNAYLQNHNSIGTVSDLNGNFILEITNLNEIRNEYLVFSFYGLKPIKMALDSINPSNPINVIMTENTQALDEVVIEGRKSISREFSIKEMDKLKIYLSPLSSADPLKAVAMLPSSTNTNETANPELRGSLANRTKVFFNGVPINNPVRNSQINGIGFFSLFNPELIKSMFVYPSNPPLSYGNTSAGMIDIETEDKIEKNNYQISTSLATTGVCITKKLDKKSFVQLYGNIMFSDAFLLVNPELKKQIKSFNSNDIGLNYHNEITNNISFNLYNYFVSESSNILLNLFSWEDKAKARTKRDFSVINLKYQKLKSSISLNAGTNYSKSQFEFGNISSNTKQQQIYISLNYKYLFSEKLNMQTGLSSEYGKYIFKDKTPTFYYAMSPESPTYKADTIISNNLPEGYIYFRWKPITGIIWGVGMRKNINHLQTKAPSYLSMQTNVRYNFMSNHSLLLSVGKYNSLTDPNHSQEQVKPLAARQVALEYLYETKRTNINLAAYFKHESGDVESNKNIKGLEIYLEQYLGHTLKASVSNTILNSDIDKQGKTYNAENNVGYFLVSTLSYFNPKLFNASIAWSNRKGKYYTPVSTTNYNSSIDFYEPVYTETTNTKRYGHYNTINLSINKMLSINKKNLIVFASVFNLLNTKNERNIVYNRDYTVGTFDYYQKRSIYFGCMLSL